MPSLRKLRPGVKCVECGQEKPIEARGRCVGCYKRQWKGAKAPCSHCGQVRRHVSGTVCWTCYMAGYRGHREVKRATVAPGTAEEQAYFLAEVYDGVVGKARKAFACCQDADHDDLVAESVALAWLQTLKDRGKNWGTGAVVNLAVLNVKRGRRLTGRVRKHRRVLPLAEVIETSRSPTTRSGAWNRGWIRWSYSPCSKVSRPPAASQNLLGSPRAAGGGVAPGGTEVRGGA
jgi:hypothetical protein